MRLGILTGDNSWGDEPANIHTRGAYWHRAAHEGSTHTYCGITGANGPGGPPAPGTPECPVCARA